MSQTTGLPPRPVSPVSPGHGGSHGPQHVAAVSFTADQWAKIQAQFAALKAALGL